MSDPRRCLDHCYVCESCGDEIAGEPAPEEQAVDTEGRLTADIEARLNEYIDNAHWLTSKDEALLREAASRIKELEEAFSRVSDEGDALHEEVEVLKARVDELKPLAALGRSRQVIEVTDVRRCVECHAVIVTLDGGRGCDCPPSCSHPHLSAVADLTRAREEAGTLRVLNGMNARRANEAEDYALALREALGRLVEHHDESICRDCTDHSANRSAVEDYRVFAARALLSPREGTPEKCYRCNEPNGGHGHACHDTVEDRGQKWCLECNRPAPENAPQEGRCE